MGRLGEIFRAHGEEYRRRFADRMSHDQLKAMRDIEACHTAAAGRARWTCPRCGKRHFTFVGCGNRHCPACGGTRAKQWLRKHCALLLPGVVYHLVTFTVPRELRRVIRSHPRELLDLLMRVSAEVLLDLAANPRWLGGLPGGTALLHTWTRQGIYHPHVHFIVTGGGVDEQGQWHAAHPRFLVAVHALSRVFRARLHDALEERYPEVFAQVDPKAWSLPTAGSGTPSARAWVVHAKPVGSGHNTLRYLSRYVYRVAFSERAILGFKHGRYIVRYRTSDTNQPRIMRLDPQELIRRFLQHVLPSRFRKIRYFGLHHASRRSTLRLLQAAMTSRLAQPLPQPAVQDHPYVPACPDCQTPMVFEERMPPLAHLLFAVAAGLNRGPPT
jgi:hypothetical protein